MDLGERIYRITTVVIARNKPEILKPKRICCYHHKR